MKHLSQIKVFGMLYLIFRNGAWLTFGNLGLQLIQGNPAVHPDDDLIVGHIAIEVEPERMMKIRERLEQLGWKSRKNVSVPNPDKAGTPVDQVESTCHLVEGIFLIIGLKLCAGICP